MIMPFNDECYNLSLINEGNAMTVDFRTNSPISGVLGHKWPWPDIFYELEVGMIVASYCLYHTPPHNLIHPKLTRV